MILDLTYYDNSILRKKCAAIEEINDEVRQLAQDLIDTVLEHNGAGLAAPQVGKLLRIFVARYEDKLDDQGAPLIGLPRIYINPILSNPSSEIVSYTEGCLSIPGLSEEVLRPRTIEIEYMDLEGKFHKETAENWRARVIMHENDHLNGVLYIDRIPSARKKKIATVLREIKKKYKPFGK